MTKSSQTATDTQETPGLQAYVSPCMTDLGTLRDLTLGASPGVGDSGGAGTFKCPGCP